MLNSADLQERRVDARTLKRTQPVRAVPVQTLLHAQIQPFPFFRPFSYQRAYPAFGLTSPAYVWHFPPSGTRYRPSVRTKRIKRAFIHEEMNSPVADAHVM